MQGVRAYLFDLDGVLIDSYAVWHAVLDATAREFGRETLTDQQFADSWGQGIEEDVRKFYPGRSLAEVEVAYERQFPLHLDLLRVAAGVPALFDRLEACGQRSAVITQTPRRIASELVDRAGGRPELIVGGTDVAHAKPAPDMVLLACRQLEVEPREAVVVGDSHYDRDAARAAGARFVGIGIAGEHSLEAVAELLPLVEVP